MVKYVIKVHECIAPEPCLILCLCLQGADISEVFASIRISAAGQVVTVPVAEQGTDNDPARQYAWEQGQIDYLGVDIYPAEKESE